MTLKPVDYDKWKEVVAELERILDVEEVKFDPNLDIEKGYSNLERLAQETKVKLHGRICAIELCRSEDILEQNSFNYAIILGDLLLLKCNRKERLCYEPYSYILRIPAQLWKISVSRS